MEYSKTCYLVYLYNEKPYPGYKDDIEKILFDNYDNAINYQMKPYHFLKEIQAIIESKMLPTKKNPDPRSEFSKLMIDRSSGRTQLWTNKDSKYELNLMKENNGYISLSLTKDEMLKAIICLRSLNLGLVWYDSKQKVIWIKDVVKSLEAEKILEKNGLFKHV